MTDNSSNSFMEDAPAPRTAAELYRSIASRHVRVEIDSPYGACVIISKAELESLEQALQILSNTEDVQGIAHALQQLVAACNDAPVVA